MIQNKTIGLVGGVSPRIIKLYYQALNEKIADLYGEGSSFEVVIKSFNYAVISKLRTEGKWQELSKIFIEGAEQLQNAGADFVLFLSNSLSFHLRDNSLLLNSEVKSVDTVIEIGKELVAKKLKRITVLGSNYTMQTHLYHELKEQFKGINLYLPTTDEKNFIHENIFKELAFGVVSVKARKKYLEIINRLKQDHKIDTVVIGNPYLNNMLQQEHLGDGLTLIDIVEVNLNKVIEIADFNKN